MRDIFTLFLHAIVIMIRLARPGGFRSVVVESVLLRHQVLIRYGRPHSLAAIPHAAAHVEASPNPVARQYIDEEERSARLIWTGTILIWIGAIGIYALGPARRVPFRRYNNFEARRLISVASQFR